ncbi:hypothetical protein ABG768_010082 [Culter alburnus]|uniref:Uncharacterized protein n=1 Tax=Culter alburnus TaxID=194366 RepID=A0AAW1ZEV7_CULAL
MSCLSIQIVTVLLLTAPAVCKDVDQSPAAVLCHPDSHRMVELKCSHSIKSYDTILWYQRSNTCTDQLWLTFLSDHSMSYNI